MDRRAELVVVEVGSQCTGQAQVTAGLEAGTLVILDPPDGVEDGARVTDAAPG